MSVAAKRSLRIVIIGVSILFVVGFVMGAIGSSLFGGEGAEPFLPTPEVHLPAQQIPPPDVHTSENGANEGAERSVGLPNRFLLTNTILSSWIVTAVLVILFYFGARGLRPDKAPTGFGNLVESIVVAMYEFVGSVAGNDNARRFFPLFATIFLFVVFNAWFGLLPFYPSLGFLKDGQLETQLLRPAGTDLNMPLALALVSFVYVEYWGIRMLGFGYLGKFIRLGALFRGQIFQGFIDIFVGMLELLSELIRIVSFTFRLFGNMIAGEILLLVTAFLIPFMFSLPFYGLELLVGFIQALIFAGLTLVFVVVAIQPHKSEEH